MKIITDVHDLENKVSANFTWKEVLYQPKWDIYIVPEREMLPRIINHADKLEQVRAILGLPMITHNWVRCPIYNDLVGGSEDSEHMKGWAWDGHIAGIPEDEAKQAIIPFLERIGLWMEDRPGWIHLDSGRPRSKRFFKP